MAQTPRNIRVLFTTFADADNFNAQSLNEREIACRLDPARFAATLFYARRPDPRLANFSHISLVQMPPRLGTLRMLSESLRGYDIVFKPTLDRFGESYFKLPARLRQRTRTIEWIEGPLTDNLRDAPPPVAKRFASFYHLMDCYVAVTEFVSETSHRDFSLHTSATIPPGVDLEVFSPPSERDDSPLRVLFVGHLIERKGPQYVLEAASLFRDVEFVLVGAPRDSFYDTLIEKIKTLSLSNVQILEPLSHHRLAQLMTQSHIMLHPSLVEGFPKVVLEAAAAGLPALIFSHYQAPVVVDGVTGFQVQDSASMFEKLGRLIDDTALRHAMGEAAASHARSFAWENITRQWEAVFEKMVTQTPILHARRA